MKKVVLLILFFTFFALPGFVLADTIITGAIYSDTTWTLSNSPYIINGDLYVQSGSTLTIEPGVVVKFKSMSSAIFVNGTIEAHGNPDANIYFTSYKDDTVGSDTNGDGSLTLPASADWDKIYVSGTGKCNFSYTVVKYAGRYAPASGIANYGGVLNISDSKLSNNGLGIYQDSGESFITRSELFNQNTGFFFYSGSTTISYSNIYNNSSKGIYSALGRQIDARNNYWGDPSGPYNPISNPTGTGNSVTSGVLYVPFLTELPGSTPPPQTIDPVIIIPGIMGSATKNGKLLIDPILHTYDDLIATLKANGYVEGKDLFTFPYEWRDSNILSANLLKDKINEVKAICLALSLPNVGCSKVDLVAHSMGGLVAREYIQSGQYQNDVDQIIFLGTPHKGSPSAYLQWEGGKFPPDTLQQVAQLIFSVEALKKLYPSLFDYIHNRPILSVQELLPIFDYLKDKDTGILRTYPNNYPRNTFLEALNTNTGIEKLLNSGVKIKNIVGNSGNISTIEKIRVAAGSNPLWINGKPDGIDGATTDHGLENGNGDTTVTTYGSTLDSSISNEIIDGTHRALPGLAEDRIVKFLTGTTSVIEIHKSTIQKLFTIQLHSPIDVVVTAPDGKKMGKNFATNEEYNEIADAFYSGFNNGDDEYITIPNPLDGNYKIEVQGTGNGGEYGVLTSYVSDNFATTTETTGITEPSQITELDVTINNQNPGNLETERVITPEVLINDINGAYDLKWIKDTKTKDALIKQINSAIKFNKKIDIIKEKQSNGSIKEKRVERFEIKANKILVQLFILELKALLKKKTITQYAFDLIKSDVEYLINNN